MASLVVYLAATVLFAQSTVAFNCSIPPIYVDIHKRAVHGTEVFQYGSFIGVGSPSQNQSLWPSLRQNYTSVASNHYCDKSNLTNCAQSTRGNFDTTLSQSFVPENNVQALDAGQKDFQSVYGLDDIHLYTHYFETDGASQNLISNTTLAVAQNGSIAPGIVGMGSTSTVLQALFDRGMIAGRTYSLYIGSGMDRAGGVINGSNAFGGYDAGRFTGEPHKYTMNAQNEHPMGVRVKDIRINYNSNQNVSIFDNGKYPDGFDARITTDQYPLSLPYEMTQNYIKELSAEVTNQWNDDSLKLNKPFSGTMTIVLDDGFEVTLPNNVMYNASGVSPVADRPQNSTEPFYMSVAFLAQVYLMADYDNYQFYLATAIQEQKAVMPRSFCPKATPTPYTPAKVSKFVSQGLIGAVIGGLVGGLGFLIFGSCLFLSWRRSRAEKKLEQQFEAEKGKTKMAQFTHFEVDDKEVEFEPPPRSSEKPKKSKFLGVPKIGRYGR